MSFEKKNLEPVSFFVTTKNGMPYYNSSGNYWGLGLPSELDGDVDVFEFKIRIELGKDRYNTQAKKNIELAQAGLVKVGDDPYTPQEQAQIATFNLEYNRQDILANLVEWNYAENGQLLEINEENFGSLPGCVVDVIQMANLTVNSAKN